MVARNDVTGDSIQSKLSNDTYRDNWDNIFNKDKEPVCVDVSEGSDVIEKLTVNVIYDHQSAEIAESITGISFDNINEVDNLMIYEAISIITCYNCNVQEDIELLEAYKKIVIHNLPQCCIGKFMKFYNQWIKDHS